MNLHVEDNETWKSIVFWILSKEFQNFKLDAMRIIASYKYYNAHSLHPLRAPNKFYSI